MMLIESMAVNEMLVAGDEICDLIGLSKMMIANT